MSQTMSESPLDVTSEVKSIIARQKEIPTEQLRLDSRLKDIGVDSLDVIEIIFALEEKFGITINYNANRSANEPFDTVAQVAAAVNKLLSDSRS